MMVSNRSILFQWSIFQVKQVTFREGNLEIMVKLKGTIRSHAGCSKFNEVKQKNWRGSLEDLCRTYEPFKLRKDQYSKDPKSGRY